MNSIKQLKVKYFLYLLAIITAFYSIYWFVGNLVQKDTPARKMRLSKVDPSSFSTPEEAFITHVDLTWRVDFVRKILGGEARLKFDIVKNNIETIFLDVSDLNISDIFVEIENGQLLPANFFISDFVKGIGSKLTIELPSKTSNNITVVVKYETSPNASALAWLTPEQTLGKKHPYLFSQCQAISARSVLPCQDTPAVKFTYSAKVHHPAELTALLSAVRVKSDAGVTEYVQDVPIPSYLLAIAVGAIESRTLGPNSKVWAEASIVDEAAEEFSETHKMLETAIDICGEYVWKEYDLLVMPPSFPFGGMENPCLTFVTPTLLAGDKSLADVVAHEISHSWTGNLVTNKNFEHFWLNEGFTMFVQGKITGRMRGSLSRDFEGLQGLVELKDCIRDQLANEPELTKLVVDLSNVSPEDAFSSVPYIKGQTFLRYLEDKLGGPESFEPFFKQYLNKYKYKSIETSDFKTTLYDYFKDKYEKELGEIDWDLWLYGQGMPPVIPNYNGTLAEIAHKHAKLWIEQSVDDIKNSTLLKETLNTLQKIEFLSKLVENDEHIKEFTGEWIKLLEDTYHFGASNKNCEIRFRLVRLLIKAKQVDRLDEIFVFANSNFRMKYVRPVYRDFFQWKEMKPRAIENYNKVKDQMMAVCSNQVAKDLGLN